MALQQLFIVQGHTWADYEHDFHWSVAAYTDKERAEEHCALCNRAAEGVDALDYEQRGKYKNPYDSRAFVVDGLEYEVVECPLAAHVDQFLEEQPILV